MSVFDEHATEMNIFGAFPELMKLSEKVLIGADVI